MRNKLTKWCTDLRNGFKLGCNSLASVDFAHYALGTPDSYLCLSVGSFTLTAV